MSPCPSRQPPACPPTSLWVPQLLWNCHAYKATGAATQSNGLPRNDGFKGRNTVHLLEASYFNIMPRWQLSTFNHQSPDFFATILECLTIWENISFPLMPDSCMFAENVCKRHRLFLIRCKWLSTSPQFFPLAPRPRPTLVVDRAFRASPLRLCPFPHATNLPLWRFASLCVTCIMTISFFNGVCDLQLSERLCIWLSVPTWAEAACPIVSSATS